MNAVGIDVSKGKSMVAVLRSLGVTLAVLIQMIFVSVFLSLLHPHIAFISLNICDLTRLPSMYSYPFACVSGL